MPVPPLIYYECLQSWLHNIKKICATSFQQPVPIHFHWVEFPLQSTGIPNNNRPTKKNQHNYTQFSNRLLK